MNASARNYHLQFDSPCIDAGTTDGTPTNDMDGFSRPLDGNGDGIAGVDMGAYEFRGASPIGEVLPQTVWHSNTVFFSVLTPSLWGHVTYACVAQPLPNGQLIFNQTNGFFTYTSGAQDKQPFSVTFTADNGSTSISQTVRFQPMPHLPPEVEVFGATHDVPNPEDNDYILRNEILSTYSESWNNENRTTRTITLAGKKLVFKAGNANGLFDYSDNENIKSFTIHAETVIIRSPLKLPQTDVTIYAKELRFEDTGSETACINTTPRSIPIGPAPSQNGANGLKAGNITLYIGSFYSDPGNNTRFIMRGGNGQPAGLDRMGRRDLECLSFTYEFLFR